MATAVARTKKIIESILGVTVSRTNVAKIIKGYLNFPEGTNEEVAQMFIDQQENIMRSVYRSHSEQKQRAVDEAAAKNAGDIAMTVFDSAT
jgi:hypothetical protein